MASYYLLYSMGNKCYNINLTEYEKAAGFSYTPEKRKHIKSSKSISERLQGKENYDISERELLEQFEAISKIKRERIWN